MRQEREVKALSDIVERKQIRVVEQLATGCLRRDVDADQVGIAFRPVLDLSDT